MNNILNIKTPAESIAQIRKADYNLSQQGVGNLRLAYWNLTTEATSGRSCFSGKSSQVDHGTVTSVETVAAKDVGAESLRHIHESLRIDEDWTERRERGFTWWAHRLPHHVDAGRPTDDAGIVVTRITSRIPILRGVTAEPDLVEKVLTDWNFISDSYC